MRLAPAFEQLLLGWKAQGWTLGPTRALFESVRAHGAAALHDGSRQRARPQRARCWSRVRSFWARSISPGRRDAHLFTTHGSVNHHTETRMPGKKVADFTAAATGGTFQLSDHRGETVVLYFYPKDNTPGCTTEGAQFRDAYQQFRKAGAVVVGCSRDSLKSHEGFKAKMEFPFELIADTDEKLCQQFAVIKMKNMYGKQVRGIERSTFVHRRHRQAGARMARREGARARRRGARVRQGALASDLNFLRFAEVSIPAAIVRCSLSTTIPSPVSRFRPQPLVS